MNITVFKVLPTTYFIVFLWEGLMAVVTGKVSLLSLVPKYTEKELKAHNRAAQALQTIIKGLPLRG
jgi:hypothetical protein